MSAGTSSEKSDLLLQRRAMRRTMRRAMRRAMRRRGRDGFTMVELLIAMISGLAVVLTCVALGRDATTNFHQEMKIASTQMTQRLAAQRLRSDLERVGFMSTGNMLADPKIAHCLNGGTAPCTAADAVGVAPSYIDNVAETGLTTLMSVRLSIGGSNGVAPLSAAEHVNVKTLSLLNGLAPDAIELAGNFTTADEFTASIDQPPTGAVNSGCKAAGGARIYLETKDPAVVRMLYTRSGVYDKGAAINALAAAFSPVLADPATVTPFSFGIRVSDNSMTHFQFATLCDQPNSIGIEDPLPPPLGTNLPRPYIDTLHALMTLNLGIGGITPGQGAASNVVVNPVQVVRWEITQRSKYADATTSAKGSALDTAAIPALSSGRFELIRTWVPFNIAPFGNVTGATPACPNCLELVGEFPVDLRFGFSKLSGVVLTTYAMDDAVVNATPAALAPATGTGSPQQIRSIFFKLGTRTAMADRDFGLGGASPTFIYRYKLSGTEFARARETVEEVVLQNQMSMGY